MLASLDGAVQTCHRDSVAFGVTSTHGLCRPFELGVGICRTHGRRQRRVDYKDSVKQVSHRRDHLVMLSWKSTGYEAFIVWCGLSCHERGEPRNKLHTSRLRLVGIFQADVNHSRREKDQVSSVYVVVVDAGHLVTECKHIAVALAQDKRRGRALVSRLGA